MLLNKTAYVNGNKVTGNIPTKTASDVTSEAGVVTIPAGYYSSQVQKQGDPSGDATAVAGDLLSGKTAYSKGEKLTGTMTNNAAVSATISSQGGIYTVPAGYHNGSGTVTANVPAGTQGTPVATKGTVSNNSITVTPSATDTTGYITGTTKTGTAVTVSASELVSGNKAITATTTTQSNIDVTNYATVSVAPAPIQSKTLTLGASAPATVTPDSGKVLSSVPITLDTSVIKAENIAKDVQMLGITGTHEGGGETCELNVSSSPETIIIFVDKDGTFHKSSSPFTILYTIYKHSIVYVIDDETAARKVETTGMTLRFTNISSGLRLRVFTADSDSCSALVVM